MLRVNVADLLRRTGTRREIHREWVPVAELVLSTSRVPEGEAVVFDGTLESVPNGVMAYGTLRTRWAGPCRRCLRDAEGTLEASVRELYERHPTEGETYRLAGEEIDLEPLLHEAVLLELPLSPLCADDCQGLCPECGVDRNREECDCEVDVKDPRWAALEGLSFPPEPGPQ